MIKVLNRQCTACLHTSSTRRQNQTAPFFQLGVRNEELPIRITNS